MKKIIFSSLAGILLLCTLLVFIFPVKTGEWVYTTSIATEASLYGFTEQAIPIGSLSLSVYRNSSNLGSDKPSVLMLHGYSADKSVWLRFAHHLADDYHIIIPDMAGHGKTGFNSEWDYSGPAQAARLQTLLDRLQVQKVHIIGNSMGGFIAAHFARLFPERTITATLVNPSGVESPEPSEMGKMLAQGKNPFQINSHEDFKHFYSMTMAQPPLVPDFVKEAVAEKYMARRDELKVIFEDIHLKDLLDDQLASIGSPVLIMWGALDQLIHVSSADVWQKGLPDSQLKIWPDIGHMPMLEIPEESAGVFREFMSRHQ